MNRIIYLTRFLLTAVIIASGFGVTAQTNVTVNSPASLAGVEFIAEQSNWLLQPPTDSTLSWTGDGLFGYSGFPAPDSTTFCMGWDTSIFSTSNFSDAPNTILFIDRGGCEFGTKVNEGELAMAQAVIICNNNTTIPDEVIPMGPGALGDLVNIPSVMLSYNDCNTLRAEVLAGNPLNVTIGNTANITDAFMHYHYGTPVNHIRSLDSIVIGVVNRSPVGDQTDVELTCDVTEPDGTVVSHVYPGLIIPLGAVGTFTLGSDLGSGPYTPTQMGLHSLTCMNNGMNMVNYEPGKDFYTTEFEITANQLRHDDNNPTFGRGIGAGPSGTGGYFTNGFSDLTIGTPVGTSAEFAVANPDSLTGESIDVFFLQGDLDANGDPDDNGDGVLDLADFSILDAPNYTFTGSELPNEIITVDFTPIQLLDGGTYMVWLQYSGANDVEFTYGSNSESTFSFSTIVADATQWYGGGWTDNPQAVARLNSDVVVGIEDILDDKELSFFMSPNPASDKVSANITLRDAADLNIQILDLTGRIIDTKLVSNFADGQIDFDVTGLSNGTYMMRVEASSVEIPRLFKFVVSH